MTLRCIASARKSLGEYKPLIRYSNGSTEVCEKSPERAPRYVRGEGMVRGNRMARGTAYPTREKAIAAAQHVIDARREDAEARYAKYRTDAPEHIRERLLANVAREIQVWGGELPK